MSDHFPVGTILLWMSDRQCPVGWAWSDGSRWRMRDGVDLYWTLRTSGFHRKYRRWMVYLPKFSEPNHLGYIIKVRKS